MVSIRPLPLRKLLLMLLSRLPLSGVDSAAAAAASPAAGGTRGSAASRVTDA